MKKHCLSNIMRLNPSDAGIDSLIDCKSCYMSMDDMSLNPSDAGIDSLIGNCSIQWDGTILS